MLISIAKLIRAIQNKKRLPLAEITKTAQKMINPKTSVGKINSSVPIGCSNEDVLKFLKEKENRIFKHNLDIIIYHETKII